MPKFNGVSEVKDNDTYEQLVKQGSFTGSDGVVYTYDQTGRLYVTDDHVEEELRGYITDLQNKVSSLESGSSSISENKLDKNLGAENSGKLLNVDSSGNITTLDNGIAGQVLTSNGGSQSPIWSDLDLPEQNVISLTGTQEDPIVLYDDIEAGKIYFLSGYIKVVQPATAYSLPDSKPTIMCVGLWLNNEKTIEVRGVHFTSTGIYSQSWNFIQTIVFHSSTSWGNNTYISLNSINGTNTTASNLYAPTTSGTSGQILQSNGANTAPAWVDAQKGIKTLIGTEDSPIILSEDIENGESYLLSGYFKIYPDWNTTIYHFPKSDSGSFVQCIGIGEDNQGSKIIELHGWSISDMSLSTKEAYPRNGTYVERIYLNNDSSGYSSSGYVGLKQINYKDDINYIWAPTSGGKAGQILQSNGNNAPTWINMPSTAPTLEEQTIESASWTSLSGQTPYTYSATITLTTALDLNSIVELINNQPVLFATYGLAIGSISGQNITIYSIGQPSESVTLTVGVTG